MSETTRGTLASGTGPADLKRAGALLTFAGLGLLLVITALEELYPGYSVHGNTISDLLAIGTTTSLIGEPLSFVFAVAWMAGGYYLFRNTGKRALTILYVLPGTGLLLAVLSPENVNVVIHSVGALMAFIPGPLAAILSYRIIKSPFRYFAVALGVLSLVGVVIEFGSYNSAFSQQTFGPGGWERIIVYPLLVWLIGFGSYLLGRSSGQSP